MVVNIYIPSVAVAVLIAVAILLIVKVVLSFARGK
jgi:hypothetical protein